MTRWDEIERLVHDRIDGLTSAADDAKLDAILAADPELSRRARELHDVVAGLRSLDREQAPADFTRRVMDRVEATRGALTLTPRLTQLASRYYDCDGAPIRLRLDTLDPDALDVFVLAR